MSEHVKIGDVSPSIHYRGDGAVSLFAFPFPIFSDVDLQVYLDNVKQSSGYSVSGAGQTAGGTVTFSAAPADGVTVTLCRKVPEVRTTDFQEGGAFRAKVINEELDRIVCMVQQVRDDLGRSLTLPVTSTSAAKLDLPEPNAGKSLKWNADGDGLENSAVDPDTLASVLPEAQKARDDAMAAASSATTAAVSAASDAVANVETALSTQANTAQTAAGEAAASATAAEGSAVSAGKDATAVAAALASLSENVHVLSAHKTLAAADAGNLYVVDASAGDVTVTLPLGANVGEPWAVRVKKSDATGNKVLIQPQGTDTIDGTAAALVLSSQDAGVRLAVDIDVNPDDWSSLSFGAAVGDATPVGTIDAFAMGAVPTGYLECNGAAVSRSTYADLFKVLGTKYGAGDGATTFNLPPSSVVFSSLVYGVKAFNGVVAPAEFDLEKFADGLRASSPVGQISRFAMEASPSGWLACKGQAVSRSTYALLFSKIVTKYGVGDGATTFNLPEIAPVLAVGDLGDFDPSTWTMAASHWSCAADGTVTASTATWNLAAFYSRAVLEGNFEYSMTLENKTGPTPNSQNGEYCLGLVTSGSSGTGESFYAQNNSTIYYVSHNGVGNQTIYLMQGRGTLGQATVNFVAGDVLSLHRDGSTLYVKHNGKTVITKTSFTTSAFHPGVSQGGNQITTPKFLNVNWKVGNWSDPVYAHSHIKAYDAVKEVAGVSTVDLVREIEALAAKPSSAPLAVLYEYKPDGTNAGATTNGAWRDRGVPLKEVIAQGWVAVSGNSFTFSQAGKYRIRTESPFVYCQGARTRLYSSRQGVVAISLSNSCGAGNVGTYYQPVHASAVCEITVTAGEQLRLQYISGTSYSVGLGTHDCVSAGDELYARIEVEKLA